MRSKSVWLYVLLVALLGFALAARSGWLPRPFRPEIRSTLAGGDPRRIGAGQYMHWDFQLPARVCTVTARMEGTGGRFYAALMGDADFRRFAVNHEGSVFWDTTAAAAAVSRPLQGPGLFHLVVSNHFSAAGERTVSTTADVACP